jgi:hypothetical protein
MVHPVCIANSPPAASPPDSPAFPRDSLDHTALLPAVKTPLWHATPASSASVVYRACGFSQRPSSDCERLFYHTRRPAPRFLLISTRARFEVDIPNGKETRMRSFLSQYHGFNKFDPIQVPVWDPPMGPALTATAIPGFRSGFAQKRI